MLVCWAGARAGVPALAASYRNTFAVGSSNLCLGLTVVQGYARAAELPPWQPDSSLGAGPRGWWLSLLLSHLLAPKAGLVGHLSGVWAGIAVVYGAVGTRALTRVLRPAQQRRGQQGRPGLRAPTRAPPQQHSCSWRDLAGQAARTAGMVLALALLDRARSGLL